jgi:hypothetical protein
VAGQAGQVLKHAVLPEQLCGLDPFEPQEHGVQQGEQHLTDAVTIVPLDQLDPTRDGLFEADPR